GREIRRRYFPPKWRPNTVSTSTQLFGDHVHPEMHREEAYQIARPEPVAPELFSQGNHGVTLRRRVRYRDRWRFALPVLAVGPWKTVTPPFPTVSVCIHAGLSRGEAVPIAERDAGGIRAAMQSGHP